MWKTKYWSYIDNLELISKLHYYFSFAQTSTGFWNQRWESSGQCAIWIKIILFKDGEFHSMKRERERDREREREREFANSWNSWLEMSWSVIWLERAPLQRPRKLFQIWATISHKLIKSLVRFAYKTFRLYLMKDWQLSLFEHGINSNLLRQNLSMAKAKKGGVHPFKVEHEND